MTTTARSLAGPAHAPVWCGDELTWLDRPAERLRTARLTDGAVRPIAAFALDGTPLSALPTRAGWLIATPAGVHHLRRDGLVTPTPWPAADLLTCDPGGRLWLNTQHGLLAADLAGRLRVITTDPTLALAWHPDTTTLYRATPAGIDAHPFDLPNGTVGPPTRISDDRAAALAVDTTGQLWAAVDTGIRCVGAACLTVPTPPPTGCCFTAGSLLVSTAAGLHAYDLGTGGHPAVRLQSHRLGG
ncbi:hypothetical protein ACFPM7_24280 [Actinokineospora guangxiensis]|uniref:Sugar lactone lactonase YvrE n=1 Tax=Actinokineospora guangxiensis TaxID=1490288 RepID=A0ABW0ETV4_9PSEU